MASDIETRRQSTRPAFSEESQGLLAGFPVPPYPPDAYLITDGNGVILDCNRAAEAKFGACATRLPGAPLLLLVAQHDQRIFLEVLGELRLRRSVESQVMRFGGSSNAFEAWVDALPERSGEHPAILWILRDLTELKAAHRSALAREAQIDSLLDAAFDGFLVLDRNDRILSANRVAYRMFGREADGLAGEAAATLFGSPLDALAVEGATRELSGIRRDGSRFPVQIAIGKTLAEDPDIRVVTVRDLSGLRSMESRLRDAIAAAALAEEHARQELAADLHDDVGQLLSLAALRIGRLRAAGDEERLKPDALVEIEECVRLAQKHCGSLAFQLSPPLLRDVGLAAATEWLAEDLERTYGLSVRVRSDGEPSLSEAVRSAAFRAVRELLINAARHADARVVLATLSCSEGRLVIAVEDDGLGFEPELDRRGFGLLHITERITALGGRFEIASSAGCGTRARLVLPLCGADASPASD